MSSKAKTKVSFDASFSQFDDDDDMIEKKAMMKRHMNRALLYSGGARAKLPKVRKKQLRAKSPFTVLAPDEIPDMPTALSSSSPPGAHSGLHYNFAYESYGGDSATKKDNELICLRSSSMSKSVEADNLPGQPPWYVGYQNKPAPPDSSIIYAASRYGFRGSRSIRQYLTEPFQSPERTKTPYTPKFLDCTFQVNEWVPPIRNTPFASAAGNTSPKLWPENTEYANGVPLKRPPTSVQYNRETTIGHDGSREVPPSLADYVERGLDVDKTLHDFAKMEASNTFLSPPMTAQLKFETMWNDRVQKTASSPLRLTLKTDVPPYSPHKLTDPTDALKYSGKTAMIVHSQSAEELQFRLRLERSKFFTPYERRWKQVIDAYTAIKTYLTSKKDTTMSAAIRHIADHLREAGIATGTPTMLRRGDFVRCFEKNPFTDCFEKQEASILFSTFDPHRKNTARFVDLVACFAVLDCPSQSAAEKLGTLWEIHDTYGDDQPPMENALSVLAACCCSDADRGAIEKLFKEQFRPACYKHSLRADTTLAVRPATSKLMLGGSPPGTSIYVGGRSSPSSTRGDGGALVARPGTTAGPRGSLSSSSARSSPTAGLLPGIDEGASTGDDTASVATPQRASTAFNVTRGPSRQKVAVRSPFNIGDSWLNRDTFLETMHLCPALLELFNTQLSERLMACYGGQDPRVTPLDDDDSIPGSEPGRKKDFSWIFSPKR